jgi:hypothetical protein
MDRDKAISLDGFSMPFFQDCWDVIKVDIMEVFLYFYVRGKFGKSINATFISLIPKVLGASNLKDFGPINLVSEICRMRRVVDKVISKPHNAFVKGRQILFLLLTNA